MHRQAIFDPQRCISIDEMRHELVAAYDKINRLGQAALDFQRVKSENNHLRGALNECESRLEPPQTLGRWSSAGSLLVEIQSRTARFHDTGSEHAFEAAS